jgi:hypothetical protein
MAFDKPPGASDTYKASTITGIIPMAPATIQSMPAAVGFQVLFMSCFSYIFLHKDIIKSSHSQYPKTGMTANKAVLDFT